MKKYQVWFEEIQEIDIIRETDQTVVLLNGLRQNKKSSWCPIFNTWEEAHNWMITQAIIKMGKAQKKLDRVTNNYNKILQMKENIS